MIDEKSITRNAYYVLADILIQTIYGSLRAIMLLSVLVYPIIWHINRFAEAQHAQSLPTIALHNV